MNTENCEKSRKKGFDFDRFLPRGDKSGSPTDLKLENLPDVVIGFCPEQGDRRAHFESGTLENLTPPHVS